MLEWIWFAVLTVAALLFIAGGYIREASRSKEDADMTAP